MELDRLLSWEKGGREGRRREERKGARRSERSRPTELGKERKGEGERERVRSRTW